VCSRSFADVANAQLLSARLYVTSMTFGDPIEADGYTLAWTESRAESGTNGAWYSPKLEVGPILSP